MDILGDTRDIDILMTKMGSLLLQFSTAQSFEKEILAYDIRKIIKSANLSISLLRLRIGTQQDPSIKSVHHKYITDYVNKIDQCENILDDYYNIEKFTPHDDNTHQSSDNCENVINSNKILKKCININNETLETLENTEMYANMTENIGNDAIDRLHQQHETIVIVNDNLNNIDSIMGRAKKDIYWFVRHMYSNKCFMALFGIAILCAIAIIIVHFYKSKKQ